MPRKRKTKRKNMHTQLHKKPNKIPHRRSRTVAHRNPRRRFNIFAGDPRSPSQQTSNRSVRSNYSEEYIFDSKVKELEPIYNRLFDDNIFNESLYLKDINYSLMMDPPTSLDVLEAFNLNINDRIKGKLFSVKNIFDQLVDAMRSDERYSTLLWPDVAKVQDIIDIFYNYTPLLTNNGPILHPFPRIYMIEFIKDLIQNMLKGNIRNIPNEKEVFEEWVSTALQPYLEEWLSKYQINLISRSIGIIHTYNDELISSIRLLNNYIKEQESILKTQKWNSKSYNTINKKIVNMRNFKIKTRALKKWVGSLSDKITIFTARTPNVTSDIMNRHFKEKNDILFTPEEIAKDICKNILYILKYGLELQEILAKKRDTIIYLLYYSQDEEDAESVSWDNRESLIDVYENKLNNIMHIATILRNIIYSTYLPFGDEDCEEIYKYLLSTAPK